MPFKKITDYEMNVVDLPDRPSNAGITTDQLKKWFDGRTDKEVKILFNNLIDELMSVNASVQIGAAQIDESDQSDGNIQAKLNFIKAHTDEIVAEMIATIRDDITRAQNAAETAAQTSVNAMNRAENAADTAAENAAEKAVYDVRELLEEHVVDSENARDEAVQAAENAANDAVTLVRAALEALVLESETAKNEAQNAKTNAETAQAQAEKARDDAQAAQRMAEDAKTAAVNAQANAEKAKNDAEQIAAQASTDVAVQAADKAAANVTAMLTGYVQDGQNARNDAQAFAKQASQAEAAAREAQNKAEEARDAAEAISGGDFLERSVYDPQGKRTDIFAEIEKKANADDVYSKTEADNKYKVMVVTATRNSNGEFQVDKGIDEILTYANNGGAVVVYVKDYNVYCHLLRFYQADQAIFTGVWMERTYSFTVTRYDGCSFVQDVLMASIGGTFTGTVKAPTAVAGTNNTQIATTAFVQSALGNLDIPSQLSNISNHYVWHKVMSGTSYFIEKTSEVVMFSPYSGNGEEYYLHSGTTYATGYELTSNGTIQLTGTFTPSKEPTTANLSYWSGLLPLYIKRNGIVFELTTTYGSGEFINLKGSRFSVSSTNETTDGGYVNDPNPNAYPISDGWTYELLGKLGEKVQFKIVTGTYTPTHKYGSSNPNKLTFDGVPLMVWIDVDQTHHNGNTYTINGILTAVGGLSIRTDSLYYPNPLVCSVNGNTISWYSTTSAEAQLNYKYSSTIYCGYSYKALIAE